jgi:hypothetical protein
VWHARSSLSWVGSSVAVLTGAVLNIANPSQPLVAPVSTPTWEGWWRPGVKGCGSSRGPCESCNCKSRRRSADWLRAGRKRDASRRGDGDRRIPFLDRYDYRQKLRKDARDRHLFPHAARWPRRQSVFRFSGQRCPNRPDPHPPSSPGALVAQLEYVVGLRYRVLGQHLAPHGFAGLPPASTPSTSNWKWLDDPGAHRTAEGGMDVPEDAVGGLDRVFEENRRYQHPTFVLPDRQAGHALEGTVAKSDG